ncbi:MAG: radical SAM protein [Candidatus Lokiarchaeota archaeon]|nr:radical SAM protein [Candidatus Lokiarchaeota archaeon]
MIKHILFLQPFTLIEKQLSDILLVWPFYLENYLKYKFKELDFGTLYLPAEQKRGNLTIEDYSYGDIEKFNFEMDHLISRLDFELGSDTLICISCSFSTLYLPTGIILNYFKQYHDQCLVVIGGAHTTAYPAEFLSKPGLIDYIVLGEGEIPLSMIIQNDSKKQNKPVLMEKRFIANLDDFPLMTFENLSLSEYIGDIPNLAINLSRGCPYTCNFCMEQNLRKDCNAIKPWRAYSPLRAVEEVKQMVEFGEDHNVKQFGFLDSIFGFSKSWLDAFLKNYDFENINSIWTETRLDILNEDLLKRLHKKKIYNMYGLEHFSYTMLEILNKTNNPTNYLRTFEHILKIHDDLKYECVLNILLNHPGETSDTLDRAFEGMKKIIQTTQSNKIIFNIKQYHNFPGTPSYENESYYHKKFGTQYYPISKSWWKYPDLEFQKFGVFCIRSSQNLPLRDFLLSWTNKYIDINRRIKEKIQMLNLDAFHKIFEISELNKMNKNLKNRYESFLSFLDRTKIEEQEIVIKDTS